ncbi:cupin domain-containing protein [Tahibacter amnicola]|uniref:Cupin domain-containing protein n=1 Tax=Tahibacter amnicola TaxID=2976241 RepID=A0ABY6BFB6_9GAMM|nr:cupin domain-containing protein [Tahibacter amnicola]UXI68719.1 cupin domain-containing protein [Tahibacter amnicola]
MNSHEKDQPALDQDIVLAIADAIAPAAMTPARRMQLRQRIVAAARPAAPPRELMSIVRAEEGQWLSLLPGISIKFLRVDADAGSQSSLWRLEPGATLPSHTHDDDEECVVLEGGVRFGGRDYGRGDFLLARSGLLHEAFTSEQGALLYIRSGLNEHLKALARRSGWLSA